MNKMATLALVFGIAFVIPRAVLADDKQLEKRLEAVEARLERMSALEEENKQLKQRLQKTEAKLEKVTAQKVAIAAPAKAVERSVAPVAATTPAITKETLDTPVSIENNWSGVYAGINAGYGTGEIGSQSYAVSPVNLSGPTQYTKLSNSSTFDGPVIGGQVGINYQLSNKVVMGAEADLDYADINRWSDRNNNSNTIMVGGPSAANFSNNQYARTGIDWLGTARLRIGYDLGKFMPYLTGGFAYGGVTSNSLTSQLSNGTYASQSGSINAGNNPSIQIGWAAGAGAEIKVADHWSLRGEYLFTQLGSLSTSSLDTSYSVLGSPFNLSSAGTGWNQSLIGPFGIHQVRFGLNYHTDWLKELPGSL